MDERVESMLNAMHQTLIDIQQRVVMLECVRYRWRVERVLDMSYGFVLGLALSLLAIYIWR